MSLGLAVLVSLLAGPGDAPTAAKITLDEAVELTRTVAPRVGEIRGLKFKRPVAVKVVDDKVAREHFKG